MLNVGLTGNIASGKSSVSRLFAKWGAEIIDADELAREVQGPGSPVLKAIKKRFGAVVIREDGSLDRDALRPMVFSDSRALTSLNAIVHPAVARRRAQLTEAALSRGHRLVVNVIPLLFEVLDPAEFDVIVLVDAPPDVRAERLVSTRGLTPEVAGDMIAAQLPAEQKIRLSHHVIFNSGDRSDLEKAARSVWLDIAAQAGIKAPK